MPVNLLCGAHWRQQYKYKDKRRGTADQQQFLFSQSTDKLFQTKETPLHHNVIMAQ